MSKERQNPGFKGKVQTVLGLIEPEAMGVTLPHEHLFTDMTGFFNEPDDDQASRTAHQPISLDNLSWIRSNRMNSLHNLQPFEEELAIREAMLFKEAGGGTIVEQTPISMGREPAKMMNVAHATGLNIIMGTAYYRETQVLWDSSQGGGWVSRKLGNYPSAFIDTVTEEHLTQTFVRDIVEGDGGARAGFIGELGCSRPLTGNEQKILLAATVAQRQTGALMTVHPGFHEESPLEIIKVLTEAGADISHMVMSHMSISVGSHRTRCKIAETGCYLEWDLFGWGGEFPQQPTLVDIPSDQGRVRQIMQLIEEGYLNQVLISHDVCNRIRLSGYGGSGYAHILKTVVPIMYQKGLTEEQIYTIMVENPKRAFTFV
jgi:phosphotriesterase-related protein